MWKRMVSFKKIPSALYSSFIISTSCVLSVPGKGTKGGSSIKGVGMNYSNLQFAFSVISEWHPALRSPHLIKAPSGQLGHSRTLWRKASESFWHKHIFSDESLHVSLLLDNQTAIRSWIHTKTVTLCPSQSKKIRKDTRFCSLQRTENKLAWKSRVQKIKACGSQGTRETYKS